MTIDLNQTLTNFDGTPLAEDGASPWTVRQVFDHALSNADHDKLKAFRLGCRLYEDKPFEITVDEAAFIKSAVLMMFKPIVCGRIEEIIEGA